MTCCGAADAGSAAGSGSAVGSAPSPCNSCTYLPPRSSEATAAIRHAAIGRVSAELVAPYPPGVPVLAPGELITEEALAALREVAADGGRIAYAADSSLATFQVVA